MTISSVTRVLLPDRLARTICEIDPGARTHLEVAVVLEVLGHNDRTAAAAGWPDLFALAQAVARELDFVQSGQDRTRQLPWSRAPEPDPRYDISGVASLQAVWLLMVTLTLIGGASAWAVEAIPPLMERALSAGILASLVFSGGLQYALTRRILFHHAQRDLAQAAAVMRRALRWGALAICAGGVGVSVVLWAAYPDESAVALVGFGYFVLHGFYRLTSVPLLALGDLGGIVLSAAGAVAVLLLTFQRLIESGLASSLSLTFAQFGTLLALCVMSIGRARSLFRADALAPASPAPAPARAILLGPRVARWPVVCYEAVGWIGIGLLYYVFLFGAHPLGWLLPRGARRVYESGFDFGMLGIIPIAVLASLLLHQYHRRIRSDLKLTPVSRAEALAAQTLARFNSTLLVARGLGAAAAGAVIAATLSVTPWGRMHGVTLLVFSITIVATVAALAPFLIASSVLLTLTALRGVAVPLAAATVLHLALGVVLMRPWGAVGLALSFLVSAIVLGELSVGRARQAIRSIDRMYYAAF